MAHRRRDRGMMESLPEADQVARAHAVLDVCRSHAPPVAEVDRVATIAAAPALWCEGHDAFDAVRDLTLREQRERTSDGYRALLDVAEIAAKIIYNASGCRAPFDGDSS